MQSDSTEPRPERALAERIYKALVDPAGWEFAPCLDCHTSDEVIARIEKAIQEAHAVL